MSTRRRGNNKRRAAPEKFEDHPDIPSEEEGDDVPVDEDEILEGSEDEIYEESGSESYAESEDEEGVSSEEVELASEEEAPPPKTKKGRGRAAAKPKAKAAPKARAAAKPKASAGRGKAKSKAKASASDEDDEPGKRYFKILVDSIQPESGSPTVTDRWWQGRAQLERWPLHREESHASRQRRPFTRICRVAADGGECTYVFSVQETTQSSAKKVFTYRGVRKELDEPQEVTKGETSYSIRFNSEVRSYKPDGKKSASKSPAKKAAAKPKAKASAKKSAAGRGRAAAKPKAKTAARGRGRGKK